MSNTFASIAASVQKMPAAFQKMPKFSPCESFNPQATISKWARQFLCVNHGFLAFAPSGDLALSLAARGKDSPEYGTKCFEVLNCLLRTVEEYTGPPVRFNVLCFTCALDGVVGPQSISFNERIICLLCRVSASKLMKFNHLHFIFIISAGKIFFFYK